MRRRISATPTRGLFLSPLADHGAPLSYHGSMKAVVRGSGATKRIAYALGILWLTAVMLLAAVTSSCDADDGSSAAPDASIGPDAAADSGLPTDSGDPTDGGTADSGPWAETIYIVDQDSLGGPCDDANPGTLTEPWCTLDQANQTLQAGEMAAIRAGTYLEQIRPTRSGEPDRPIIYAAYDQEQVIVRHEGGSTSADLRAVSYITVYGITFDGADRVHKAFYINDHGDHITIQKCVMKNHRDESNESGYGIWVDDGGASHLLVEDCQIFHNGTTDPARQNGSGIHIFGASDHITIRNCDIYESHTEDGLHLGMRTVVSDVLVEDCRFWGNKEDGIDIKQVDGVTVRNSSFWGHGNTQTGGGAGIVIHMGAKHVTVDQCTFHDNEDGVAILWNHGDAPGSTEHITVQRSQFFANSAYGIHLIGGDSTFAVLGKTKNVFVYHNTIHANRYGLIVWAHVGGDVTDVEVFNNIFWQNTDYDLSIGARADRIQHDYNDFSDASVTEPHGLHVDPAFVDSANHDYSLQPSSPVIDVGTDVGLPFGGAAPDLGALEHGGS